MAIIYAKIPGDFYFAGLSMFDVEEITRELGYDTEKIEELDEGELPNEYFWSAKRVELFPNWHANRTYMLMKNFEESDNFRNYFPDAQIN